MAINKIGKHGANASIDTLANYLTGPPESFTNSNGSFEGKAGKELYLGRLPEEWKERYDNTAVVYTVFSYATPIAWLDNEGEWIVPAVKHSATTSQHQSKLKAALTYNGREYTETL